MSRAIRADCSAIFQQTHFYRPYKRFIFAMSLPYLKYIIGMVSV
jgi:hypothetical protein